MAKIKNLEDFLIDELKDLYSAENQIIKALPKMAKAATSEELKAGFEEHLKQTEAQVKRLDKISKYFEILSSLLTCASVCFKCSSKPAFSSSDVAAFAIFGSAFIIWFSALYRSFNSSIKKSSRFFIFAIFSFYFKFLELC